ncbi:flagellar filament capping protein FliD [Clostridium neonatale]|uniref:flagellar filament capping protein FliD n=2 Tax=Clostridium neonatale TaxID=137838 RepID=UPI003D33C8E2
MSSVSRTRATNLTGLIDIDSLVEANLLRQKTKINTATQKMKVEQYKQEQYREVITKSKKFYNKYCDILSGGNLLSSSTYNAMKATSSDSSSVTATASTTAKAGNYKVNITQVATSAKVELSDLTVGTIKINDKDITISGTNREELIASLNQGLAENGIKATAKYSDFANNGSGGIIIQTEAKGSSAMLKVNDGVEVFGTNIQGTITDMSTNTEYKLEEHKDKIDGNSIKLDGVTFNFTDKTNGDVTIGVKADGTELKDKIVEFINDYNELLGHINGKLYEEYDRSYLPLTDEDKEGLSDSEIEKLEKKAQTGLLKNDSYLRNFADDMKMTMSTVLTSGQNKGLSLEKIGIKPVEDYSTQNGLFTIDEDKLLSAIEENPDGIKELFSGKDGIVTKLSDNLKDHATGTFSRLAKKAGVADGVTANTNEMTKDIEQRKKLITQMQTALQEKEDALYTKYSTLESNLASLQSQQSSLSSYFQ